MRSDRAEKAFGTRAPMRLRACPPKRRKRCAQYFAASVYRAWNGLVERKSTSRRVAQKKLSALADRVFARTVLLLPGRELLNRDRPAADHEKCRQSPRSGGVNLKRFGDESASKKLKKEVSNCSPL